MPIYEFRCDDCERSFETFVMPGRADAECPGCGGNRLTRELSVFAARAGDTPGGGVAPRSGGGCCGGGCGCA
jgi:putative FmdB family regulatory protein